MQIIVKEKQEYFDKLTNANEEIERLRKQYFDALYFD